MRLTSPAALYVANDPFGVVLDSTAANSFGSQSSGLRLGANPSRNHASATPVHLGTVSRASPMMTSSTKSGSVMTRWPRSQANAIGSPSLSISAKGRQDRRISSADSG